MVRDSCQEFHQKQQMGKHFFIIFMTISFHSDKIEFYMLANLRSFPCHSVLVEEVWVDFISVFRIFKKSGFSCSHVFQVVRLACCLVLIPLRWWFRMEKLALLWMAVATMGLIHLFLFMSPFQCMTSTSQYIQWTTNHLQSQEVTMFFSIKVPLSHLVSYLWFSEIMHLNYS